MSMVDYLEACVVKSQLAEQQLTEIENNLANLRQQIGWYFSNVKQHFQFGSSIRDTALPKPLDSHADIDYMLIFDDSGYLPKAYLKQLKGFLEHYYEEDQILHRTESIELELSGCVYELIPSTLDSKGRYQIPNDNGEWLLTNPADLQAVLNKKDLAHHHLLKSTIRLAKYWNAQNGYVYESSYLFEKWIAGRHFSGFPVNQKEYFFHIFDNMRPDYEEDETRKQIIQTAREQVYQIRELEKNQDHRRAEIELRKLIPEMRL